MQIGSVLLDVLEIAVPVERHSEMPGKKRVLRGWRICWLIGSQEGPRLKHTDLRGPVIFKLVSFEHSWFGRGHLALCRVEESGPIIHGPGDVKGLVMEGNKAEPIIRATSIKMIHLRLDLRELSKGDRSV